MGGSDVHCDWVVPGGEMMILVTGGAGFIGSHVCERLLSDRQKVVCLDNFNDYYDPKQKRNNISAFMSNPDFALEEVDILDQARLEDVFKRHSPTDVIHLAARAGVRPSLKEPSLYFDVNVKGTINLLELSKGSKVRNFVFGSSSSVYGDRSRVPFIETDQTESQISPYASSKKCGELICRTYSEIYGLNITCLRFFTVYGPRGRPDMAPFKFFDSIYNGKEIEMYGDGTSERDYTYVTDIVDGIMSALDKCFRYEIFNLGNSSPVSLKEFISIIEDVAGKEPRIIRKEAPLGDVQRTFADISKSENMLGYRPKVSIKEGMQKFAAWYTSQRLR
jgi:UDP-glucuronate 4-epimerase